MVAMGTATPAAIAVVRVSSEDEEDDDVSGEAVDVANTEVAAGDAVVEAAALELTIIEKG